MRIRCYDAEKRRFALASDIRAMNTEVPIIFLDCKIHEGRYLTRIQIGC